MISLTLVVLVGALFGIGVYLILQRSLTRIVVGLGLIGHSVNLLLLATGGRAGEPPVVHGDGHTEKLVDPVPQALALTAIVIGFGVSAFLLALAYRRWTLTHDDEVENDLEDRRIALMAQQGRLADEEELLPGPGDPGHGAATP